MTTAVATSASSPNGAKQPPASAESLIFRPILAPLIWHRGSAAALGLASAVQVVATVLHLPAMDCPFLGVTGIPCPGCGLSRACAAMVTGAHEQSLRMHAFAVPVLIGVAILIIAAAVPEPTRLKLSLAADRIERATGVTFLLLIALLLYWLGRLLYAPGAFISLVGHN